METFLVIKVQPNTTSSFTFSIIKQDSIDYDVIGRTYIYNGRITIQFYQDLYPAFYAHSVNFGDLYLRGSDSDKHNITVNVLNTYKEAVIHAIVTLNLKCNGVNSTNKNYSKMRRLCIKE